MEGFYLKPKQMQYTQGAKTIDFADKIQPLNLP